MRQGSAQSEAGFTLVEMVIVMAVLGVLSAYALMANSSPAGYTMLSQAQKMAADIRHAQAMATSWGRSLRITAVAGTNGSYSVSCVTSGASPCDVSPVIDPATGSTFSVNLQRNVALSGPATLDIDSLGSPSVAATYVVSGGGVSTNVSVAAVTGFVSVP